LTCPEPRRFSTFHFKIEKTITLATSFSILLLKSETKSNIREPNAQLHFVSNDEEDGDYLKGSDGKGSLNLGRSKDGAENNNEDIIV